MIHVCWSFHIHVVYIVSPVTNNNVCCEFKLKGCREEMLSVAWGSSFWVVEMWRNSSGLVHSYRRMFKLSHRRCFLLLTKFQIQCIGKRYHFTPQTMLVVFRYKANIMERLATSICIQHTPTKQHCLCGFKLKGFRLDMSLCVAIEVFFLSSVWFFRS